MPVLRNRYVLAVPDAAEAARFLRDTLGFRTIAEPPGWVFVMREGCMVMLGTCPDALHPSKLGDHAYFGYLEVDDASAMHAAARARAPDAVGPLEEKPWGMREFAVRMPDGHSLAVGQPLPGAPAALDGEAFARSWLAAFNARDVEAIMAHYADDIEHSSPTVVRILGDPSGVVRGKAALRDYFERALAAAGPDLQYAATRLYVGAHGVTLLYDRSGGKLVAETFQFDGAGKVRRAFVAHAERQA